MGSRVIVQNRTGKTDDGGEYFRISGSTESCGRVEARRDGTEGMGS